MYAYGLFLYEIASGNRLITHLQDERFDGLRTHTVDPDVLKEAHGIVREVIDGTDWEELELPDFLSTLLGFCLDPDPSKRPSAWSVMELWAAFERTQRGVVLPYTAAGMTDGRYQIPCSQLVTVGEDYDDDDAVVAHLTGEGGSLIQVEVSKQVNLPMHNALVGLRQRLDLSPPVVSVYGVLPSDIGAMQFHADRRSFVVVEPHELLDVTDLSRSHHCTRAYLHRMVGADSAPSKALVKGNILHALFAEMLLHDEIDFDEALDFDHLVDIGNLLPNTTYFYEIQSTDGTGNASEVILRSFRTLAEPDLLAPAIVLGPVVTALSNTTAQIEWASDEDAAASLTYLEEGLEVTLSDADLKRSHAVVLSGLLPATAYEYWITLADGSGNNSVSPHFGFTTPESPDTTSPAIIKGPFVSIVLHDQAVVEWQTDESSDSSVEYGLTTGAGESVAGADVVQEHMIRLTGLQPGSIYHYRVLSRDTNGNEPTVSAIHTFETLAAPDTEAPEITATAVVVERSDQSASIGWSTNELATGFVEYGVGPEFGSVAVSEDLVDEHLLRLTHLEPATQYHFRVGSTDLVGNGPTYGAENTFFTKCQNNILRAQF